MEILIQTKIDVLRMKERMNELKNEWKERYDEHCRKSKSSKILKKIKERNVQ